MNTDNLTNLARKHKHEISIVAATGGVIATFALGTMVGVKINAKHAFQGRELAKLINTAAQTGKPSRFLWQHSKSEDILEYSIKLMK